jgi:hypothetical protein
MTEVMDEHNKRQGFIENELGTKRYLNSSGELHNENGPALIYSNGNGFWFLNGEEHTEEEFDIEMNIRRVNKICNSIKMNEWDMEQDPGFKEEVTKVLDRDSIDDTRTMLQECEHLTSKTRMELRGHPLDNFQDIADLWSVLLKARMIKAGFTSFIKYTALDYALMMGSLKTGRQWTGYDPDNELDTCGYGNNQRQIVDELKRRLDTYEGEQLAFVKRRFALLMEQVGL